jgi:cytochrome c peroxidase
MRVVPVVSMICALAWGVACGSDEDASPSTATSTAPTPAQPAREPLEPLPTVQTDARKVVLGRRLFHDTQLSGDGTLSCASCHSLDMGGTDQRRTSIGIRGQVGGINSPTVLNSGLNFVQFWDGRAASLAEQALGPVTNPVEMGATFEQVIARLNTDATYREAFSAIYPDAITKENIADAIAEYERTLLTPSRFDRYLRGDRNAITAEERRGYETFKTVGCVACHQGPNVGGSMYQKMGLVRDYFAVRGNVTTPDFGRYNVTRDEADRFRFKVPSLRNITLTAPYLHDGSQLTLEDVVKVMGRFQLNRELNAEEVRGIVAFLGSLTGTIPAEARMPAQPAAVPAAPSR